MTFPPQEVVPDDEQPLLNDRIDAREISGLVVCVPYIRGETPKQALSNECLTQSGEGEYDQRLGWLPGVPFAA